MPSSAIFETLADYYDLLYRDKDYAAEADHASGLMLEFSAKRPVSLLDAGCGTGNYSIPLARQGYAVTGVDQSEKMIRLAREKTTEKIEYRVADLTRLKLGRTFDGAVSLFNVINYFVTDEQLDRVIHALGEHLTPGGVFIFDSWYGPAVLADPPTFRTKHCETDALGLTRTARPEILPETNEVTVAYELSVRDKTTGQTRTFEERHHVRYFFRPEMEHRLKAGGFEPLSCREFLTGKPAGTGSWNVCFVARKK